MKIFFAFILVWFTDQQASADPFHVFEENGKIGLKNQQGDIVIPASYEALGWSNGTFSVVGQVTGYKLNDRWGLINLSNQRITPSDYFFLTPGEGSLLVASKRSSVSLRITTGCIDPEGKTVIPFSYSGIKIHGLRAITFTLDVNNRMKYGLIDLENKTILPAHYQNIYPLGSLRYAVQNTKDKTALFTENGEPVTGFVIDSISPLKNDLAIIYQNGNQGLINREGGVVKEAIFREIRYDDGVLRGRMPDEWSILTPTNTLIKKIEADSIVQLGSRRLKVVTARGSQLVDVNSKPVFEEAVDHISSFNNGLAVYTANGKKGVIRRNGKTLLFPGFDNILIGTGYFIVQENQNGIRKWSVYDTLGNRLTKNYYDQIRHFNGSFFPVKKNGFEGALDKTGNERIACVYDSLGAAKDGLMVVKFRGLYGIISEREEWKVPPQVNRIELINGERFFEKSDGKLFVKSLDGNVLYFTDNPLKVIGDGLVEYLSSGGKWTINLNGQIIDRQLPPVDEAESVWPATEGLRMIKRHGRYGFIDDQGRLRIPNRYDEAMPFQEGRAAIKIRKKWGFINADDKFVIQPAFEVVTPFSRGFSLVKQKGKWGFISPDGKEVLPNRYDSLIVLPNRRILMKSDGMVGLADTNGDVLLFPKYERLEDLDNGYVIVKQNGKFGLMDLKGLSAIPVVHDWIYVYERNIYALKKSKWIDLQ